LLVRWYLHFGIELMKMSLSKVTFKFAFLITFAFAQGNFNLEDLNPLSESYGQFIGPEVYLEDIVIIYFGHEY
jgi:hypothetical protein